MRLQLKIFIDLLLFEKRDFSKDVSQPSLGPETDHPERTTPPLSPMYSSDGQSAQISASSRASKIQVVAYTQPSSKTGMETHWEEAIHCSHPEKKWEKLQKKLTDISIEDDTESELRAITESDMSDSTLQGSVQDSFEEVVSDSCFEKQLAVVKSPKENYLSHIVKVSTNKDKPTWIIGSEDESVKLCDNRAVQESKTGIEYAKNCSRLNSTSSINGTCNTKTVTTDFHKQVSSTLVERHYSRKPAPLGKHKKMIEPSITPVCTPVSDFDDFKNNQTILPTPSLERLLPIGSKRAAGMLPQINFLQCLSSLFLLRASPDQKCVPSKHGISTRNT